MARVIAFYVPAKFKPGTQRLKRSPEVIPFDSNSGKDSKSRGFRVALEKMFPERHPQTQG
jgi:hypothetical protein